MFITVIPYEYAFQRSPSCLQIWPRLNFACSQSKSQQLQNLCAWRVVRKLLGPKTHNAFLVQKCPPDNNNNNKEHFNPFQLDWHQPQVQSPHTYMGNC
jgi:hypothetical protein